MTATTRTSSGVGIVASTHANDPRAAPAACRVGIPSPRRRNLIAKADLPPAPEDLRICRGDRDTSCIADAESGDLMAYLTRVDRDEATREDAGSLTSGLTGLPSRFRLWELLFAHRDYFWRIGLCVPGGDPADWGRDRYDNNETSDEL